VKYVRPIPESPASMMTSGASPKNNTEMDFNFENQHNSEKYVFKGR